MSSNALHGPAPYFAIRRAWLPCVFWLVLIAYESTPFMGAQTTSRLLLPIIKFFAPHITFAHFQLVHHLARKIGHFVGYAMLSFLMFRAWWATLALSWSDMQVPRLREMLRSWIARAAAIAWLSTAAVAGLDEWHQTSIPGRTGTVHDVVLDSMAAAFVQFVLIALSNVIPWRSARARREVTAG